MQQSRRSTIAVKHIFAILGWAFGAWLTISLSFEYSFPGVGHRLHSVPPGTVVHLDAVELLVMYGPNVAGVLVLGMGLLGLLPGTNPKDDDSNQS